MNLLCTVVNIDKIKKDMGSTILYTARELE